MLEIWTRAFAAFKSMSSRNNVLGDGNRGAHVVVNFLEGAIDGTSPLSVGKGAADRSSRELVCECC